MQTTFTVNLADFKKMLTDTKKISKRILKTIVKISVQPHLLEFQFVGIQRTLPAKTETYCDVLVPFDVLFAIAKTSQSSQLTLTFRDGEVQAEDATLLRTSIKVQTLFSNKEMPLPINPSLADILNLRKQYDAEKLIQLNLLSRVELAEQELKHRLHEATILLGDYGVKFSELESLVNSKLN